MPSPSILTDDPLIGEVLDERYRIEAELGSGAMGVVYRARHVKIGRAVAVKVLHPHLVNTPTMIERFEREANVAAKLRHQNLVGLLDVGTLADGRRTMILEFANGPSLADVIGSTPIPPARAIFLLRQLCDGLDAAHRVGLIHRDMKPDNIVIETAVDGTDVPRIIDFGIALLRDGVGDAPRLTEMGMVLGTPAYMAPEQATGSPLDARCDLFALGVIAYEMLAGQVPFEGTNLEVVYATVSRAPPPIATRSPGVVVDPRLEAIVMRLMAKRPADRFPDARAVRDAIDAIAQPTPVAAPPTEPARVAVAAIATDALPTTGRHRNRIAIVVALVIAAIAITAVVTTRADKVTAVAVAVAIDAPPTPSPVAPPAPTPPAPTPPAPTPPAPTTLLPRPPIAVPVTAIPARPRPVVPPVKPPIAPAPIVPVTPAEVSAKMLVDRYVAIGKVLANATAAQQNAFRAIQLNDALATPATRRAAMKVLDAIGAASP